MSGINTGEPHCNAAWRREVVQIKDSLGRLQTLPIGRQTFARLGHGSQVLFFGLGPRPDEAINLAQNFSKAVLWLECPEFMEAMRAYQPNWPGELPQGWQGLKAAPESFDPERMTIFFYRHNARLFPEFWGPLWAQAQITTLKMATATTGIKYVLLPGGERDLLHKELYTALKEEGYTPLEIPPAPDPAIIAAVLREAKPRFALSVNMRGINAEIFYLLQACNVPVAMWMVDNPWHILSQSRLAWWREAHIFATDPSFIPSLKAAGAGHAYFLPLATCPQIWSKAANTAKNLNKITYVGRSSFPDQQKFFSAVLKNVPAVPPQNLQSPLDFHWWMENLGITRPWPGHDVRRAGLMAEKSSLEHKKAWLQAAGELGLTIFGDSAWGNILGAQGKELDLRHPVDYYHELPDIYASASYVLNVTSLLLPAGLTQRHFDVWAAGGFLLSNHNAGLQLFPHELAKAIAIKKPRDLTSRLEYLENNSALRLDIQSEFKKLVLNEHTYRHRIAKITKHLEM